MKIKFTKLFYILTAFLLIFLLGFLLPSNPIIPVKNATPSDWNHDTFWYYPWGSSVVHRGIDIFAETGIDILASNGGIVIYAGHIDKGGNIVAVLTSKWQINYYAHLNSINVSPLQFLSQGDKIGTVGETGNAIGKPPHLHYTIFTPIPYFWRYDSDDTLGWQKIFYLNPDSVLQGL